MPEAVSKRAAQADALIEANRMARIEAVPGAEGAALPEAGQDPEGTDPTPPEASAEGEYPTDDDPGASADAGADDEVREQARLWEQRWRSLDGQLKARDRQIAQMQEIIASLQSAPTQAPPETKPQAPAVSKDDEDAFGADLVDMVVRAARAEAGQVFNQLMNKITELESKLSGVESTATTVAHGSFEERLGRLVPDWERLNYDQGFIDWLQSSPARNKVFTEAASAMDVSTVAEFFIEYKKLSGKAADPRKAQLNKQVAPGRGRAAPAAPEPEKKIWSRADIVQLYRDKAKYSREEFAKLEKDLFAAQQQGRVDL